MQRVLLVGLLGFCSGLLVERAITAQARPHAAPVPASEGRPQYLAVHNHAAIAGCTEQTPQPFLVRANWLVRGRVTPEVARERRLVHELAVRYRTETYGFFAGFGQSAWHNPDGGVRGAAPMSYASTVSFMGLRTRVHRKIHGAIACAEREIQQSCGAYPYRPQRLSGIRDRNTYHNGEVSNHVYGIALDIDPTQNTCCSCVAEWQNHPLCSREVDEIYERMSMPECWVHAFERYGFYWLGRDQLQDTMHFEFLGDPDRITAPSTAPAATDTPTSAR